MRKTGRSMLKKVISLMLVLSVVAIPGTGAQAGETDQRQSGKNGAYLVEDDGSETKLTDEELKKLRGESVSEVPEDYMLEATDTDGVLVDSKTGEFVTINDGSADRTKVKMKELSKVDNDSDVKLYAASDITAAPNSTGKFEVYNTYFNYYPFYGFGNVTWKTSYTFYDVYMEYSSDGANWTRVGPMAYSLITTANNQGYSISGLQPNTTYMTRLLYGSSDYYGNTTYGPAVASTTIKTGMPTAPKIKSIQAKAVNVKYRKVKHYWYGIYMYTEKFYTCKVKIIIKLKKRPGTAGIAVRFVGNWMGGPDVTFWMGGNKKKYSKKFTPYPNYFFKNPRKRSKCTIYVCSGQSSEWGGLSPMITKNKRLS